VNVPLPIGTRLGAYEVLALIGQGGMGEVYRARDSELHRDIALKILPESCAADPERLARFGREAQVLAALNHPNIAQIYAVETSGPTRALVMELVEGETLAERIAKGPLPLDEALLVAKQVAEALEAAHEQGIVHRDLKPANIKVRPDGTVKVLDFGLAKLAETSASHSSAALANSPTITSPAMMTGVGVLLGTAAYMSPEQAKGRPADKRSDIWAFGCVVYEMLTGSRAFDGDDVGDTLATILKSSPDWRALPATASVDLRRLLLRCLNKDSRERLQAIGDARVAIGELLSAAPDQTVVPQIVGVAPRWRLAAIATGVLLIISLAATIAVWISERGSSPAITRLTITSTPAKAVAVNGVDRNVAITPDGTRVVYVGGPSGSQVFVRALDQLEPMLLSGVDAPRGVFVSPDGQWVGFFEGATTLKKVPITGGPPVPLGDVDGFARGAAWGPDGTIVFATTHPGSGLQRVSANGGAATVLTHPNHESGEADHLWPEWLPDGRGVLFTITQVSGSIDRAQLAVLDLQTGRYKVVLQGGSHAHYVPSGHLVYAAAGTLRTVAFDQARLETVGTPVPVVTQAVTTTQGAAEFDVARNGTLVYVRGDESTTARKLVWVDREGQEEVLTAPPRMYFTPQLSPDGSRVAVAILDQDNDIWIWAFAGQTLTRVTADPTVDNSPVWTPDGQHLLFASQRKGPSNIYRQMADPASSAERLTESLIPQQVTTISPDGADAVVSENRSDGKLMLLALHPPYEVRPLLRTPFIARNAGISPNGHWLAYEANEAGHFEVFVRPFPDVNSGHWPVSTAGGTRPRWARGGTELFYVASDGALMSVSVDQGTVWNARSPKKIVEPRYFAGIGGFTGPTYDVSLDGKRFLMIKTGVTDAASAAPPSIVVEQHFDEELKRLLPTK
jgi:serine/threonine-protein kinase